MSQSKDVKNIEMFSYCNTVFSRFSKKYEIIIGFPSWSQLQLLSFRNIWIIVLINNKKFKVKSLCSNILYMTITNTIAEYILFAYEKNAPSQDSKW